MKESKDNSANTYRKVSQNGNGIKKELEKENSANTYRKVSQNGIKKELEKEPKTDNGRETWGGKLDFLMSALSFAVGMGNLWRFPYLCYRNGGGAFLVPYILMMVVIGIPLVFLEFAFGQFGRSGIVAIWKGCPMFQGIGWSMFLVSLITSFYYNMLNAWCLFYIGASFAKSLPWESCGNPWNENCVEAEFVSRQRNCTAYNGTFYNDTCYLEQSHDTTFYLQIQQLANITVAQKVKSPSDEYFHNYMLEVSKGITNWDSISWKLVLCLFAVWCIVGICLIKGIKTSGKVTYVTSLLPYVVLLILFVRGITLEGAKEGIMFYIVPEWNRLKSAKVWVDAGVQVFFSLSACWGGLITLSSYNDFNNNCMRDAIIVATGDCLTSIFGGFVVFSFIGYMAHDLGVPIPEVATNGAGLAFTVYPQAVTTLPISQLWSVLFFLMLINVGLGSQLGLTQTIQSTLVDGFPETFGKGKRPQFLLAGICFLCFVVGLLNCTSNGIYTLQLLDTYAASYALFVLGIALCVALQWFYGSDRFSKDIQKMLGQKPSIYWIICWKYVTPVVTAVLLVFTVADFSRTSYGDITFPIWCDVIGFSLTSLEVLVIPGVLIFLFYTTKADSWKERYYTLSTPREGWGIHARKAPKQEEHGVEETPLSSSNDRLNNTI